MFYSRNPHGRTSITVKGPVQDKYLARSTHWKRAVFLLVVSGSHHHEVSFLVETYFADILFSRPPKSDLTVICSQTVITDMYLCFTSVTFGQVGFSITELHGLNYRSGTVNSNTVNSKFHLIQSYCDYLARFLSFHV